MRRDEVLEYMKQHPFERFKLDWWSDDMLFYFDGERFVSGAGGAMDINFLLDGNFVKAKSENELLGGLFDFA